MQLFGDSPAVCSGFAGDGNEGANQQRRSFDRFLASFQTFMHLQTEGPIPHLPFCGIGRL
jgi:hypothetical protein